MWKKPNLKKPGFEKVNIKKISENELVEINGGVAVKAINSITSITAGIAPIDVTPIELPSSISIKVLTGSIML